MIPADLIVNAIIEDGFPEEGVMHKNITRLIDNIDLVPSLKLNVIIDAAYKRRKGDDYYRHLSNFHTLMWGFSNTVRDTLSMSKQYIVTDTTITLMVEWTNSTSHQAPLCRRYHTNFSDFADDVAEFDLYKGVLYEPIDVLMQLIGNLTNPLPIDAHLNLTGYNCRLSAEMVQFLMKHYYHMYYTLLKPVDILFENEDNENIPKTIRTFVPYVKSHDTMMFPYIITKYLIDHDHPECIRYLGSDIVDDLIDFCTEVDVNVVPYLIEYCERSTIQDRFKL